MATKQEKAVQQAVKRAEKRGVVREERHVLWFLLALILLLLWLLFAQHNGWWPYSRPKLGSAFYTNIGANTPLPASASTVDNESDASSADGSNNGGTGNNSGSNGTNASNGSNGSNGSDGSNGGTTTTPPASSSLLDFAGQVNVGATKGDINAKANGLGQNCAVIVNTQTQTIGKQEVCTYTEGDKIVTVTYLNDRVISASKSGF